MAEMRDYTEFTQDPLVFPIGGKTYTVPEASIELGLRLARIIAGEAEQEMRNVELYMLILGSAWDEMLADGVPLNAAMRAGMVAVNDYAYGRDYALASWEAGLDPKAMAALMQPEQGNRASRRSKSTAAARKTRSQASTSGTTSPTT